MSNRRNVHLYHFQSRKLGSLCNLNQGQIFGAELFLHSCFCTFRCYITYKSELNIVFSLSAFEQDYPTYIFRKNYSNFVVDTRNRSNREIALEFFSKLEDINLTP